MRKIHWLFCLICFASLSLAGAKGETPPALELKGHASALTVLAWSPDSQMLASSAGWVDSKDNTVRLWKPDGTLITSLPHTMPAVNLAWSPDGQVLATASWDESVRLWGADGGLLNTLKGEAGTPFGLSWSPDGEILAVASVIATNNNVIRLWSADGSLLNTLRTQYSGGKFLNVAWSPDGTYLAGGAIDYHLWKADGSEVFQHESCEHCTPAWGLAWSPDSHLWAFGNESGAVWVYDVEGNLVGSLQSNGNVDVMTFSPDGEFVAGGGSLWRFSDGVFGEPITVSSNRVSALAWSPDSRMIASAAGAFIRVSDIKGQLLTALAEHTNSIQALAWSPDGQWLASGSVDRTVRLWDMTSFK